jgi:hypothetical protein
MRYAAHFIDNEEENYKDSKQRLKPIGFAAGFPLTAAGF